MTGQRRPHCLARSPQSGNWHWRCQQVERRARPHTKAPSAFRFEPRTLMLQKKTQLLYKLRNRKDGGMVNESKLQNKCVWTCFPPFFIDVFSLSSPPVSPPLFFASSPDISQPTQTHKLCWYSQWNSLLLFHLLWNPLCDKCALSQSLSPLWRVTRLPLGETRCLNANWNYLQIDFLSYNSGLKLQTGMEIFLDESCCYTILRILSLSVPSSFPSFYLLVFCSFLSFY